MTKHLHLVRHGEAEATGKSDKSRVLSARGREEALKISVLLALRTTWPPDIFCASTAQRTSETAEIIAWKTGISSDKVKKLDVLYAIDCHSLLQEIQKFDNAHNVVAVCGHNPSMTLLTKLLSGKTFDRLPTCGSAYLKIATDNWQGVAPRTAELLALDTP